MLRKITSTAIALCMLFAVIPSFAAAGAAHVQKASVADEGEKNAAEPSYLLYQDFERFDLQEWTCIDADGDGHNWWVADSVWFVYEGEHCITSASWESDVALTPDNWLISPAFTATDDCVLSWYDASQSAGYPYEHYSVYVLSADYENLEDGTKIYDCTTEAKEYTLRTVEIGEFKGQSIRIAFRHHESTDMYHLNIDCITVVGTDNLATEHTVQGDYVLVFNPSEDKNDVKSTGTVTNVKNEKHTTYGNDFVWTDTVIPTTSEQDAKVWAQMKESSPKKTVYSVGDLHTYKVLDRYYQRLVPLEFICKGVGEYCTIWTVTDEDFTPLADEYVADVIEEFDGHYGQMHDAFGDFYSPDGTDRVNILFYDIIDECFYTGSGDGTGGYFWASDLSEDVNNAALLHIDSPMFGYADLVTIYSAMFHELQHMINYCVTGGMNTWLNECMSMAAQELIYYNSDVPVRLYFWNNANYMNYHKGRSHFDWDGGLAAYSLQNMFGQYLRAQTGDYTVFSRILQEHAQVHNEQQAVVNALSGSSLDGMSISDVILSFRIATIAKQSEGIYGFCGDERFDELEVMPVSGKKDIYGCGAVVYRTVNGTYTVPYDADTGLVYVGISESGEIVTPPVAFPGPDVTGITLDKTEISLFDAGITTEWLNAAVVPFNAENQNVIWTSSDETVAKVEGGIVTAVAEGTAVITATSEDGGFTAECTVTVEHRCCLFFENFENSDEDDWTTVDADGDGYDWFLIDNESFSFDGAHCISSYSWYNTPLTPDNWLILPAFTATDDALLSWYDVAQDKMWTDENYSVYVLPADYTELDEAVWVYNGVPSAEYELRTANLGDFSGQSIRIAFRHHDCTDMYLLSIDCIAVTSKDTHTVMFLDGLTQDVIGTETVEHGADAVFPEAPAHEGYTFTGWDSDGRNITEDTTITAMYEEIPVVTYTVTFFDGLTHSVIGTQTVEEGKDAELPEPPDHENAGFVFTGWDKDGKNITADTEITAQYAQIGDINGDGRINTADAVVVLKSAAEMIQLDEIEQLAGDCNHDGKVNTADAVLILKYAAGMITKF